MSTINNINYLMGFTDHYPITTPNLSDIATVQDLIGEELAKTLYLTSKSGMLFIIDSDTMLHSRLDLSAADPLNRIAILTELVLNPNSSNIKMFSLLYKEYEACEHATNQSLTTSQNALAPT